MQTRYETPYNYRFEAVPKKPVSIMTSVTGLLLLCLFSAHCINMWVTGWSPTETAKQCFLYPEERKFPDKREIAQMLLSAAFFGSDASYFDDGEENTGHSVLSEVLPSELSGESSPDDPLIKEPLSAPQPGNIYSYDPSLIPEGEYALLPYDLSGNPKRGEVLFSNTTGYTPDADLYLSGGYPITTSLSEYSADEPLILILHTHGTESFAPAGAVSVPPSYVARDSDPKNNMIAVGKVMADTFNGAGIPTIHCEIMHDLESYSRAYDLAADTIQRYLKKYPSIQYVFDVHRDAVIRENGDYIRPITVIEGEITAQIMLLVGTNEKGADHPDWETNMTVAATLQKKLTTDYTAFARPINIRGASFNEQFTKGSLLIEIGSAANTLSEAKNAARHLTYSMIGMIKEYAD